ncbi:hypothetical protein BVY03_01370 [bacterium K02(2017)]|nr:hypothetical protein BVY03_01370 [bacterium K02(2017)]
MGLAVNTNIASLRAQHALSQSYKGFKSALTRLSTGLRINSPSDDVVGMGKASAYETKIRGMKQAQINIGASTGLLNVSEGYLSQLTDISQKMRELAVQSAESTLSSTVRTSLVNQFSSLRDEFDRLTDNAQFNGTNLLGTGAFGNGLSSVVQIGPDANDTLTVTVEDTRIESIGRVAIYNAETRTAVSTNAVASSNFTGPDAAMTVNGIAVPLTAYSSDGVSTVESSESAIAYVNAINSVSQTSGVRATVVANVYTIDYNSGVGLESNQHLVINGVTVKASNLSVSLADDQDASTLVGLINDNSGESGVMASLNTGSDEIVLTATDGRNIHMQVSQAGAASTSFNVFGVTGAATNTQMVQRGSFRVEGDAAYDIVNADGEFTSAATESVAMDEYGDDANGTTTLSEADVSTSSSAGYAITILGNVLNQLQLRRANVGSQVDRLDRASRELDTRLENLQEAKSVIKDSNIAEETANLTKYQIMQQAGMTVLSQANASPRLALSLLNRN